MAGTAHESDVHGADGDSGSGGGDCSFMWDDDSQLSGFYHDPNAGWYYSTRDGLYYRYEDGDYVPWESDEVVDYASVVNKRESCQHINAILDTGIQDQPGSNTCFADDESADPSPPSEWLEETLINMYLKGYSTEEANVGFSTTLETDGDNYDASGRLLSDSVNGGSHTKELNEVEEDRNIAEDVGEQAESSGSIWGGDAVSCEEIWLAQYGQVIKQEDDNILPFPAIDLWDWRLVDECGKKTSHVSRLVGRLVKQSMKLHPSMPAGGGILKTAPVCEVQLDLVRVATVLFFKAICAKADRIESDRTPVSVRADPNLDQDWIGDPADPQEVWPIQDQPD
ncbi:hypothetical protein Taro_021109 [Colocasia esculenta]|uniref:OCRE domain-containing protein n=1 Tax=Colocasia esculenta TaxID=4460 RepID=A0A843V0I3_COLES|nr:hypothetical protein [Colocasia esculenta]